MVGGCGLTCEAMEMGQQQQVALQLAHCHTIRNWVISAFSLDSVTLPLVADNGQCGGPQSYHPPAVSTIAQS